MTTAYYPSASESEVIQVEFLTPAGDTRSSRLLVDCGFTGNSSLVLSDDAADLVWAEVPPAHAMGALQGRQNRAWVTCRIQELTFQRAMIAILADLVSLSLPAGVEGIAGLRFLRHFARWGAERTTGSAWRFFLTESG